MFAQELFTALLISSVANLGAVQVNKNEGDQMCDITVGDVLGPLKQGEGDRDTNFSLLSYSFSLVSTVTSNGLSKTSGDYKARGLLQVVCMHLF